MRALIIDEETAFTRVLQQHLVDAGYEVSIAASGAEGLAIASHIPCDVVLLDVRLPDMDGRQVCARLRAVSGVPIIIVSALGDEQEIVLGLNAGADDYVVKPFRVSELLARVSVQLRRSRGDEARQTRYDDGELRIDLVCARAERRGERVHLSRIEFRILSVLVERAGHPVSAEELAQAGWGTDEPADGRRVALYISYLRRKLEDDARRPVYIRTVRGQGYCFGRQFDTGAADAPDTRTALLA